MYQNLFNNCKTMEELTLKRTEIIAEVNQAFNKRKREMTIEEEYKKAPIIAVKNIQEDKLFAAIPILEVNTASTIIVLKEDGVIL